MPLHDLRTFTNMGGKMHPGDTWKVYEHEVTPGSQTPEEALPPTQELEEINPPKPKRKRRTKAQIQAEKEAAAKLEEANTKDLKDKGIK